MSRRKKILPPETNFKMRPERTPRTAMRLGAFLTIGLALLFSFCPALEGDPASSQKQTSKPLAGDYKLLIERNIFSRSRGQRPVRVAPAPKVPAKEEKLPPPPVAHMARFFVLVGTIAEDDHFVAFVEDRRDGTTKVYSVGDEVAEGKIVAINMETLEFLEGDKKTTAAIGKTLLNTEYKGAAPKASPASADAKPAGKTGSAVSGTAPAPAATPSPPAPKKKLNPILERLRKKRLEVLKK